MLQQAGFAIWSLTRASRCCFVQVIWKLCETWPCVSVLAICRPVYLALLCLFESAVTQTYWLALHVWLVHSKQHMIQDCLQTGWPNWFAWFWILDRFCRLCRFDTRTHAHAHARKKILLAGEGRSLWKRHLRPDHDPWLQVCFLYRGKAGDSVCFFFFDIQIWHPRRRVFEWSWLIVRLWLKILDCTI